MAKITFFKRLARQILSGKKTATIRDKSDSNYYPGQIVTAYTHEDHCKICRLTILAVEEIELDKLTSVHAKAENLPFVFILKWLLRRLYPATSNLYFISFKVLDEKA